jgi:hypothetical protein
MRKILVLAAVLAAVGMASRIADARDRTFSFWHFSPHAGTGFHLPHHGGFFGKHRHFKPWPFGHFGHGGFVFKFGDHEGFLFGFEHVPHFKPWHFGHFGHKDFGLRFGDHGGSVFKFGHIPHFKPHPFGLWHGGSFFKFSHRRHFEPGHLMGLDDSSLGAEPSRHGAGHGPASFEIVLKQLEEQGFRHVPRLLRARNHWQPGT